MPAYNRDIPAGPHNPSADQDPMKTNFNTIDTVFQVDHLAFTSTNAGYHNLIHLALQGSDPAPITGITQVYSKNYTADTTGGQTDTQLFSMTGLGGLSQLTGNFATSDGWVWIGGLLLQWGQVNTAFSSGSTTGTVVFKDRVAGAIPFPNNCFGVWTNAYVSFSSLPTATYSINIRKSNLSNTQFQFQFYSTQGAYQSGFAWIAIGN